TKRDLLGDQGIVARADKPAVGAAKVFGVCLSITGSRIEQTIADLVTAARFQAPDALKLGLKVYIVAFDINTVSVHVDVGPVIIGSCADDPSAEVIVVTDCQTTNETIANAVVIAEKVAVILIIDAITAYAEVSIAHLTTSIKASPVRRLGDGHGRGYDDRLDGCRLNVACECGASHERGCSGGGEEIFHVLVLSGSKHGGEPVSFSA